MDAGADSIHMLMVEVVAYTMVTVIGLTVGGLAIHAFFQFLIEINMSRVARVEASNLDDELRRLNERRNGR